MASALAARNPLESIALAIPAWQPGPQLVPLVDALIARGFTTLIVVDDGSGPDFRATFDSLAARREVRLLRHAVNLGKGRALKTAINFVLTELPGCAGLLTADADGQHAPDDIVRVAEAFLASPDRVVLGSRTFSRDVPLRSRFRQRADPHHLRLRHRQEAPRHPDRPAPVARARSCPACSRSRGSATNTR